MLPFLLKNRSYNTGLSVSYRKPDEKPSEHPEELDHEAGLEECAKELLRAIEAKDHKALMGALHSFFMIADAMPHKEGGEEEPKE